MAADRWVDIVVDEVVWTTDLAALVVIDDEEIWLPFSQMEDDTADHLATAVGECDIEVTITRWIAREKGLI